MATELVVGVVGNGVVVIAAVVMAVVVGSENSIRARSKIGGGLVLQLCTRRRSYGSFAAQELNRNPVRELISSYHIISYHIISGICSAPITKRT